MSFTKSRVLPKAALLCALSFFVTVAAQAETKIGYVRNDRILSESAPAKIANQKIDQEFSKREKDLQEMSNRLKTMTSKFDKDSPVLNDADRVRRQRELADLEQDLQRKRREFREDLNQRRNEELAAVIDKVQHAIKQIAETEKFDLILQDVAVIYSSPNVDITDKVIKALNNK